MTITIEHGLPTVRALAALEDYDEVAVRAILDGIGWGLFRALDEGPGFWGYEFNGVEWHWKLRRFRNSTMDLAEVLA
jgi:hypothetical protein